MTWAATLAMVAPPTLTDGVSAAKSFTGSLKATTTVGVSLWPKVKTEVCALSGKAAVSGLACCSSTSNPRG